MRRIGLARFLVAIARFLPKQYPLRSASGLARQPFFIVGSGRNGSTLLNRTLNLHSKLFLPSEQYFLGPGIVKYQLYNFLNWRDLTKIVSGELLNTSGSHTWDYNGETVFQELVQLTDKGFDQVIHLIFHDYGKRLGERFEYWGDSTPPNIHFVKEIYSLFPNAKFIFLVRDGRDVVASHKNAGREYVGEMADITNASGLWNKSVDALRWLEKRTRVLNVRYEEFVTEKENTLKDICEHLKVDFEHSLIENPIEVPGLAMFKEPIHANLIKPVSGHSIGRYRDNLTKEELNHCESIIGENLKRMGYS